MENSRANKAENILESLNGIERAAAPDYFYTRLQARMHNEVEEKPFFLFRPAFITPALGIVLLVNIFSLFEMKKVQPGEGTITGKQPSIESFANAYDMNEAPVYE